MPDSGVEVTKKRMNNGKTTPLLKNEKRGKRACEGLSRRKKRKNLASQERGDYGPTIEYYSIMVIL